MATVGTNVDPFAGDALKSQRYSYCEDSISHFSFRYSFANKHIKQLFVITDRAMTGNLFRGGLQVFHVVGRNGETNAM